MVDFTPSSLEKIERLLNQNIGDRSRLEHIKKSIIENKRIYNSDIHYIEWLELKRAEGSAEDAKEDSAQHQGTPCWKCEKGIVTHSRYCSFCGAEQSRKKSEFDQVLSRRMKIRYNPIKMVSHVRSYQILAAIGGLAALIPILIAIDNLGNILESIEFYTRRDFSGFTMGLMTIGAISGTLSCMAIVIPFLTKKPKKVGRILFFSSFGILISSALVGSVGFVIILFAGILALKKRY